MLPKQRDVEIPLLQVLVSLGGQGKSMDIYPLVTGKFPNISEDDLKLKIPKGRSKWHNRIQWVRLTLIKKGDMYSPKRGIWAITDKGRARVP